MDVQRKEGRWSFEKDGDGNVYIIPSDERLQFRELLAESTEADDFEAFSKQFARFRVGSSASWSFADPRRDA